MSKIILGPVSATFKYCPGDSKIKGASGSSNDKFYLYKSSSHPNKYYGAMVDDGWDNDNNRFILYKPGYIKTSLCDLEIKDKDIILYREKGDKFIFTILDKNISNEELIKLVKENS